MVNSHTNCKKPSVYKTRGPWIAHLSPGTLVDDALADGYGDMI